MPASGQLTPQGDHRERVARLAEGGEQEAPGFAPGAQTSSASVRIIEARSSAVAASGVVISVPTPAAL